MKLNKNQLLVSNLLLLYKVNQEKHLTDFKNSIDQKIQQAANKLFRSIINNPDFVERILNNQEINRFHNFIIPLKLNFPKNKNFSEISHICQTSVENTYQNNIEWIKEIHVSELFLDIQDIFESNLGTYLFSKFSKNNIYSLSVTVEVNSQNLHELIHSGESLSLRQQLKLPILETATKIKKANIL